MGGHDQPLCLVPFCPRDRSKNDAGENRGAPSSRAAEHPVLKSMPSPDVAWICFSSGCKNSFPREFPGSSPGWGLAGLAGREGRQDSQGRASPL